MDEYLPFGGPRPRRTRNTKRRVTWRNFPHHCTSLWQLFDERRDVWLGPAPIAQIRKVRQQLYEHRYLVAEASDLGDTDAQALMMLLRDAYIQLTADGCPDGQLKLHIVPNPMIALVDDAMRRAGWFDQPSTGTDRATDAQKKKIAEIIKQLDKA